MTHIRHANRKGTAAELAERSSGYTANGESEFTRHVAHGAKPAGPGLMTATANMTRRDFLIFKNCRELVRIEERIRTERDPATVERLIKNASIKRRFIDQLRRQT